jgi:hypothetical protein
VDNGFGQVCVATDQRRVLLKAHEAAEYLRISLFTLNKIQRLGLLAPFRTPGGHRRYTLAMLNQYLEESRSATNKPAKTEDVR